MATRRRWLQFSLRTAFVGLTVFAIWLGVAVNRAREQREAVKAIEALGGIVFYDWQLANLAGPQWPLWLRRSFGNEFFQEVDAVGLLPTQVHTPTDSEARRAIPHLKRLRRPKKVWVWKYLSDDTYREVATALPNSEVLSVSPPF